MIQYTAKRIVLQLLSSIVGTTGIVMLVTRNVTSGSCLITAAAILLVVSVCLK